MRVLFTGIAGTHKAELAKKLSRYAAQKKFDTKDPPDLNEKHIKNYIQFHEVEDKENFKAFLPLFLGSYNENWKKEILMKGGKIMQILRKGKSAFAKRIYLCDCNNKGKCF